jgi:type IV fimbrial biogenesis protein FimT
MYAPINLSGITLIELTVALSVVTVLIAIAIPAFVDLLSQYRLKAASDTLYSHLQFAKSEAIKRNKHFRVNFTSISGTWCYGLKEDSDCDCTQSGACHVDGIPLNVDASDYPDVSIETHISSPGDHFNFDNVRGIMDSTFGHVRLNAAGKQIRVIVSRMGRIRLCSPAGDYHVNGYSTSC